VALAIPFQIAYLDVRYSYLTFLEVLSLLVQYSSIVVILRTPVLQKGGYTVNFCAVVKNYYLENGLILDLIGSLPLNLIFSLMDQTQPHIIFISVLRVLRIASAWRFLQLFEIFEAHLKSYNILMYIAKSILFLFFLGHWTNCWWFYINRVVEPLYDFETSWLEEFDLLSRTIRYQYMISWYYVIKIATGLG